MGLFRVTLRLSLAFDCQSFVCDMFSCLLPLQPPRHTLPISMTLGAFLSKFHAQITPPVVQNLTVFQL